MGWTESVFPSAKVVCRESDATGVNVIVATNPEDTALDKWKNSEVDLTTVEGLEEALFAPSDVSVSVVGRDEMMVLLVAVGPGLSRLALGVAGVLVG